MPKLAVRDLLICSITAFQEFVLDSSFFHLAVNIIVVNEIHML